MPDDLRSDRELMLALACGDETVLASIIERWERPLYSFAFRYTQNDSATREIVQETFVRVYLKRERFDPKYPLSSWIFTIASNLCKNKARWRRRHPEVSMEATRSEASGSEASLLEKLPSDAPIPSAIVEDDEQLEALKQAVMSLPHDLRTSVLLHHYENMSYKEISEVVGCSVRGVETRLYRARKLLRARIEQMQREESRAEKKTALRIDEPFFVVAK